MKYTRETLSYNRKSLHLLPFEIFGVGNEVFVGFKQRYPACRSALCKKSQQSQLGVPVFVTINPLEISQNYHASYRSCAALVATQT